MNTDVVHPIQLRWLVSFPASCLHAARAIARGQLVVDPVLAQAVTEPAQELRRVIQVAQLPQSIFWQHLLGLTTLAEGSTELAARAATKVAGRDRAEAYQGQLAGAIGAIENAVRRACPTLVEEVTPAANALRRQWEETGASLLPHLAQWTDARLITESAEVIAVLPATGGGGAAHLPYNNVHLEAVTEASGPLPEVLRLTWMLAQLNLDLPIFSEAIHPQRLPHIAELAMVPPTLQAAEAAGLCELGPQTMATAVEQWNIALPADLDAADLLDRWWGTYLDTRPRFAVALTALDRMVG